MTDENKTLEVESVMRLDAKDGDALIVTLPPAADMMPGEVRTQYIKSIQESFEQIFHDKKVRVIIIPHGMKVELVSTSELETTTDDASS